MADKPKWTEKWNPKYLINLKESRRKNKRNKIDETNRNQIDAS